MRQERFTFLCSGEDRRLIAALAAHLQRTQSDAIRWVVRRVAGDLGVVAIHDDSSDNQPLVSKEAAMRGQEVQSESPSDGTSMCRYQKTPRIGDSQSHQCEEVGDGE